MVDGVIVVGIVVKIGVIGVIIGVSFVIPGNCVCSLVSRRGLHLVLCRSSLRVLHVVILFRPFSILSRRNVRLSCRGLPVSVLCNRPVVLAKCLQVRQTFMFLTILLMGVLLRRLRLEETSTGRGRRLRLGLILVRVIVKGLAIAGRCWWCNYVVNVSSRTSVSNVVTSS